jgi:hypothetical protein
VSGQEWRVRSPERRVWRLEQHDTSPELPDRSSEHRDRDRIQRDRFAATFWHQPLTFLETGRKGSRGPGANLRPSPNRRGWIKK